MSDTRWLSCHVDYACRHSGVCCRAGWPLPVEARVVPAIEAAVSSGRVRTVDGGVIWLHETADAPEDMAGTLRQVSGGCVFHVPRDAASPTAPAPAQTSASADRACAVHGALGHEALPSTCQHFPRVCLVDDRGVRVSLSHVCPTAAAMLLDDDRAVAIVPGSSAVPGGALPEGLDARDMLPPRLSDRVLMDLHALTAWEGHVIARLAGPDAGDAPVEATLARLGAEAALLSAWAPGATPLAEAVAALADGALTDDAMTREAAEDRTARSFSGHEALTLAASTCRAPWTWAAPPADLDALDARFVAPAWPGVQRVVRRYLAARAFGAWVTYLGDAVVTLVAWLHLALAVLRAECARACGVAGQPLDRARLLEGLRQADLLLVHYADTAAIADQLQTR